MANLSVKAYKTPQPQSDTERTNEHLHDHQHQHGDLAPHAHPHYHQTEPACAMHTHAHATSFEALTYIVSPLHELNAGAKLIASLILVLGIVTTPALTFIECAALLVLLGAICAIARLPLGRVLRRSAAVLPFVVMLALFAPLQAQNESLTFAHFAASWTGHGWLAAWSLVSRVWLAALCMVLLTATTTTADLLGALQRMHVPDVFIMLLSFITRYVHVFARELHSLRIALASRGPHLRKGRLLRSFGSIGGSLLVRSYERGERIYAAMLSRGYTGSLPSQPTRGTGAGGVVLVVCALLTWAALALY